jgi:hypothetical protein
LKRAGCPKKKHLTVATNMAIKIKADQILLKAINQNCEEIMVTILIYLTGCPTFEVLNIQVSLNQFGKGTCIQEKCIFDPGRSWENLRNLFIHHTITITISGYCKPVSLLT